MAGGFDGSVSEGDYVRVSGRWEDGTLHSKHVENLTTGASLKTHSMMKLLLIVLAVVAAMAIVFVVIATVADKNFNEQVQQQQEQFQQEQELQHQEYCDAAAEVGMVAPGC